MLMMVHAIDHIVFNVRDVDASASWYEQALSMERHVTRPETGGDERTYLTFGVNKINLRPIAETQDDWFTGDVPTPGSEDLCFLTHTPPEAVAEHFRNLGIDVAEGPITKTGAQGSIRSVYVRDPDGNLIEVSSYR